MFRKYPLTICFIVIATTYTISCTPVTSQHGNLVKDYQIEEIKPGEHTRSDVLHIMGSPTTQSTINNDIWYYIGQETEKHGIMDQKITNERILRIAFDSDGIVSSIDKVDGNRHNIPYSKDKTPTHGNDLTVMQQLLGNLGRFSTPERSATDY